MATNREVAKAAGVHHETVKRISDDAGLPGRDELIAEAVALNPEKSNREIARELGVSDKTVGAVRGAENGGNRHSPQSKSPTATTIPQSELDELNTPLPTGQPTMEQPEDKPRAEPITNRFTSAIVDLNRVMAKFDRITNDPNFPRNKEKVAALHRHDLTRSISELQALADQLN